MKLPIDFRQKEIKTLLQWAVAGESALIVGSSGVGKSNLFNHLLDPSVHLHHLKEQVGDILFVRVNFHYATDFTDRTLYSLILDAIERQSALGESTQLSTEVVEKVAALHDALLDVGDDSLRILHIFRRTLRTLFQYVDKLILLCDQFDDVYHMAHERLFANLRGLREAYKYRLAFFLFMRDPLERLAITDSAREEFDELFVSKLLPLQPYNEGDALVLCRRIASRFKLPFAQPDDFQSMYKLTGGHAGLLRVLFLATTGTDFDFRAAEDEICAYLLTEKDMLYECAKLWRSLSIAEQRLLWTLATKDSLEDVDSDSAGALYLLQLKGFVKTIADDEQIFAPVLRHFITITEHPWLESVLLDERRREVWVNGRMAARLHRQKEFQVFCCLYQNAGEGVSREDLMEAAWRDKEGTDSKVFDQALDSVIYRLRQQIEEYPKKPKLIVTERNYGYRLDL